MTLAVVVGGPKTKVKVIRRTNSKLIREGRKISASDLEGGHCRSVQNGNPRVASAHKMRSGRWNTEAMLTIDPSERVSEVAENERAGNHADNCQRYSD